jgi:hypothetical protein
MFAVVGVDVVVVDGSADVEAGGAVEVGAGVAFRGLSIMVIRRAGNFWSNSSSLC